MANIEPTIMLGLGIISAIFAYYGLAFIEHNDFFTQLVGKLFFASSLIFLLITVNTVYLIIVNNGLTYLQDTVGEMAITVFYYAMLIGIVMYILYLFIQIGVMIINTIKESFQSRGKSE